MATTKSVIKTAAPKEEIVEQKVEAKEEKKTKEFKANDLITVRSVTQGELLLPGKKSEILYRWSAYGDVTEVEYQDLYALKSTRSEYIYGPLFVIEDEDLLENPRWKDVGKIYETMYDNEDLNQILSLPLSQFKATLKQCPKGFLDAIKIEVATRIDNGTFDSLSKIRAIDEICGTDLLTLIG